MKRLVLAGILIVSACAQSTMSVEAYSAAMEIASDAYVQEAQSLSALYQASVEDDVRAAVKDDPDVAEDRVVQIVTTATSNYLTLLADAMARFVVEMDELRPPAGIDSVHDEFVAAVGSVQGSLPGTRDAVAQADSLVSVRYALTSSGFADGQDRWTAACTALEEAVRAQGTGIDLGCVRRDLAP